MILREFSSTPTQSINKLNKRLDEQYGITVKQRVYTREKLEQLRESATKNVQRLKEGNHKFQLDPEYAKFLGVKDVTEIMLREGIYEGGRAYMRAEQFIRDTLDDLIQERGYDDQHARMEAMNRCRMQADALPDSIYEEILERCMMEMTSAGGVALEEQPFVEDGYDAGVDEGEISDWITTNAGNGAGLSSIHDNEYEYVIEVYVSTHGDGDESPVLGGEFRDFLWEICERIGCVDVQGPEFTNSADDAEYWSWRLMKDVDYDEALYENVNVDEAEVVMALRAQSNVLADQIEKLGRMINEDLLKIAEQIGNEMGQDMAQQVQGSVTDALQQHLESARAAKEAMDAVVQSVAQGQAPGQASPDLDAEEPAGDMPDMDLDLDDEEMADAEADGVDINEPAASGPEDAPMGRAEI